MNPRKDLAADARRSATPPRRRHAESSTGAPWRSWPTRPPFRNDAPGISRSRRRSWSNPLSRRQFLTLMGASLALAGVGGCSIKPAPSIDLVPYVRAPEEVVPGKPLFFATAMTLGGAGVGLLVESHVGRPTKIEGNPDHPASLGATRPFHQASILTLYDPDRSQTVTHLGKPGHLGRGLRRARRRRQGAAAGRGRAAPADRNRRFADARRPDRGGRPQAVSQGEMASVRAAGARRGAPGVRGRLRRARPHLLPVLRPQ